MRVHLVRAGYSGCDDKEMEDEMSEEKYLCPQCGTMNNELRAEIARRDERIAELEAMVNPASFKKFLIGQIKDPELAKEYAKACIQDDTYKELLARRDEELKITDGLLKEATETIGAVIACCTYNSNDDAKIGIFGIDQKAFTMIDQFITHYNDAISAGKVSVDVKRELTDAEINELVAQEAEKRDKK